jgi:hypothetical protein
LAELANALFGLWEGLQFNSQQEKSFQCLREVVPDDVCVLELDNLVVILA